MEQTLDLSRDIVFENPRELIKEYNKRDRGV